MWQVSSPQKHEKSFFFLLTYLNPICSCYFTYIYCLDIQRHLIRTIFFSLLSHYSFHLNNHKIRAELMSLRGNTASIKPSEEQREKNEERIKLTDLIVSRIWNILSSFSFIRRCETFWKLPHKIIPDKSNSVYGCFFLSFFLARIHSVYLHIWKSVLSMDFN